MTNFANTYDEGTANHQHCGERHATFLVALADDADQSVEAVDRRDFKRGCLADAQAARIHQQEAGLGDRASYAADDGASLSV